MKRYGMKIDGMKRFGVLGVSLCLFIVGKIWLFDTYFFWDSVSTLSKPAHFLYDNNFSSFVFPADMVDDNLALSSLIALLWKLFGRSLIVTHLFFTLTGSVLIYQIYRLCEHVVTDKKALPFVFLLLLSDAALVTQGLLIMTDSLMLLFAVMSIRYILENRRIALAFALVGLSLLRARGFCMTIGIGMAYYGCLLYKRRGESPQALLWQALLPFLPSIIVYGAMFGFRVLSGSTYYYFRDDSPWAIHYHFVSVEKIIKNILVIGRFFIDQGRCFLWIALGFLFCKHGKRKLFDKPICPLLILLGGTLGCMLLVTLPFNNPMGIRYFMLQYLLVSLLVGILLFRVLKAKTAKIICALLILGLWTGHLWVYVYPEKLSKGWDTYLTHLPYYAMRQEMIRYLDEQHIPFDSVATFFPVAAESRLMEMSTDKRRFPDQDDYLPFPYVLHSNLNNADDLTEDIADNKTGWILEKEFAKGAIFMQLYRKRDVIPSK